MASDMAFPLFSRSFSPLFAWSTLGLALRLWLCLSLVSSAWAYIPASPVNGTDAPPDASGTNGTDASYLNLQWFGGGYQERISYQLVGAESNGISKVSTLIFLFGGGLRSSGSIGFLLGRHSRMTPGGGQDSLNLTGTSLEQPVISLAEVAMQVATFSRLHVANMEVMG